MEAIGRFVSFLIKEIENEGTLWRAWAQTEGIAGNRKAVGENSVSGWKLTVCSRERPCGGPPTERLRTGQWIVSQSWQLEV